MKVATTIVVDLDKQTQATVFWQYIERELLKGRWMTDDGKVWEEHCTSHRFDADITAQTSEKDKRIIKAVQELRKAVTS